MGWKSKLEKAKRLHRPSLKNWQCDDMAQKFDYYVRCLDERKECRVNEQLRYDSLAPRDAGTSHCSEIPLVTSAKELSVADFIDKFERPGVPGLIRGIPKDSAIEMGQQYDSSDRHWQASQKWDFDALDSDNRLRERFFKCGEDDRGKSVKVYGLLSD